MTEKIKKQLKVEKGNPQIAGVTKWEGGYNFTAVLGAFNKASLILYRRGSSEPMCEIPIDASWNMGNVVSLRIEGLSENLEYNYLVDGKIVTDPMAKALTGRRCFGEEIKEEAHSVRAMLNAVSHRPSEVNAVWIPYEDMILYKLHVRGFTKSRQSGVSKKGTFLGLTEKIPYLQSLGVTSVELMPAYEFLEIRKKPEKLRTKYQEREPEEERVNFWGYTGGFYFAPKAAYCAGRDSVREFQECVDSFHRAGMEVIMEFYFDPQESPIKIVEILRFWTWFYHVDGFHLSGSKIPSYVIAADELLKGVKIFCEGFDEDQIKREEKEGRKRLAEYNMGFLRNARCFLKGDEDQVAGFVWRNRRNPKACGVVNYITSQDGFTLADLLSYNERHNEANGEGNRDGSTENFSWNCGVEGKTRKVAVTSLRRRMTRNAILLMMLSQGVPMLYGGDEMGNSQMGNNNAWCQDNEIGWIDWKHGRQNEEVREFVRKAIAFRKEHTILHLRREIRDTDYRSLGAPEISYHSERAWFADMDRTSREIGIMYCGAYVKEEDLYVIYNMSWKENTFGLPVAASKKEWYKIVDTSEEADNGFYKEFPLLSEEERELTVPPRTIIILSGR